MTAERTTENHKNGSRGFARGLFLGFTLGYLYVEASQISPRKIAKALSEKLSNTRRAA